jgi:hypothetical protein
LIAAFIGFVYGGAAAAAQGMFREMSATRDGRGRLTVSGDRDRDLDRAAVTLERDGTAVLRFYGARGGLPLVFTGRWTGGRGGNNGDDVDLTIRNGFGDAGASGRGTLNLRRGGANGFDRIEIRGTTEGARFSIDFEASGRGYEDPDRSREISTTYGGSGRLVLSGGRDLRFRRMSVELERDGDARLRFTGDGGDMLTLTGRWSGGRSSGDILDLDVRDGFGRDGASGRGRIYLGRRGFRLFGRRTGNEAVERVEITGSTRGRRFSVDFDTRGGGGEYGGGYEGDLPGSRDIDVTSRGRGRLTIDGDRDQNLDRARVVLRRDGEAEVQFTGDGRHTFRGRWSETTGDDILLRVTGDFGRDRVSATGTVNLRRRGGSGGFDRVELRGTGGRPRFTIRFDAD